MIRRTFVDGNPWHTFLTRIVSVALLASFVFISHGVPVITRQPPETLVDELGAISTFSVEVTGDGPLSYQWFRYAPPGPQDWNEYYIPLDGQTNSSYTPRNLMAWRQFAVAVSDQSGSVTSRISTLSLPERFAFQRIAVWPEAQSDLVAEFRDFIYKDDTILAATRTNWIVIIDVSDPSKPQFHGTFPNPGRAIAIERHGNIAAVASATAGIDLLDITDPRNPVRLSTAQFGANVREVVMAENTVFAVTHSFGDTQLYSLNISDPANPVVSQPYRFTYLPSSLIANGTKLFLTSSGTMLRIFEAADPTNIFEIGAYKTGDGGSVVTGVKDNFLFVSSSINHFILDVSDLAMPSYFTSFAYSSGGIMDGDYLISGLNNRFQIHDVSTPTQPAWIGAFYAHISPSHIEISGNDLFAIEDSSRLVVYSHLTNPPAIINQPQDLDIYVSENSPSIPLVDTLQATGALPLTYQWYLGSTGDTNRPVQHQNLPWLGTSEIPQGNGPVHTLWVRVSNHYGSVDSRTVTVTWIPQLQFLPAGQLRLIAAPSTSWTVQSSIDLRTWTNETSVTVSAGTTTGTADITPPSAPSSRARYFRLIDKPEP